MSEAEFRVLVADFVAGHGTQLAAARTIGVSHTYLGFFLRGQQKAGPKIARFFGLEPHVTRPPSLVRYEPIETRRRSV